MHNDDDHQLRSCTVNTFWTQFKYSISHQKCQKPLNRGRMKHSFFHCRQLNVRHSNCIHSTENLQLWFAAQFFSASPFVLESTWSNAMSSYLPPMYRFECTKYTLFRINNSVRLCTKMDICFYSFLLFWTKWFATKPSASLNDGISVHCQLVIGIRETCDRQSEI